MAVLTSSPDKIFLSSESDPSTSLQDYPGHRAPLGNIKAEHVALNVDRNNQIPQPSHMPYLDPARAVNDISALQSFSNAIQLPHPSVTKDDVEWVNMVRLELREDVLKNRALLKSPEVSREVKVEAKKEIAYDRQQFRELNSMIITI